MSNQETLIPSPETVKQQLDQKLAEVRHLRALLKLAIKANSFKTISGEVAEAEKTAVNAVPIPAPVPVFVATIDSDLDSDLDCSGNSEDDI